MAKLNTKTSARCSVLGARCSVLGAGCSVLGARARCSVPGVRCSVTQHYHFQHNPLVVVAWRPSDANHLNSAHFQEAPGRPRSLRGIQKVFRF
jgi:hypothetical protein